MRRAPVRDLRGFPDGLIERSAMPVIKGFISMSGGFSSIGLAGGKGSDIALF